MNSIYELIDVTDDDTYYMLGLWTSLDSCLAEMADCKIPSDIGSPNEGFCDDGYAKFKIRKHDIGWSDWGETVYSVEFTQRYDEDRDEYLWDRRDWN